jgi:putative ABC transport system permease protein
MSVIWQKVWSDLWDNKVRTILAVLSIAVGVFAVGVTFGMADQMLSGMDKAHQAVYPSHISMYMTKYIDRDMITSLERLPGVAGVEAYNSTTVRYKVHPEDEWKAGILVMRDDYEHQTYDVTQLKEGVWPEKDNIAIERLSSQYYGVAIGDKVIFEIDKKERLMPVTGKVRHPFVPPPQFGGQAVFFMDAQGFERFDVPEGQFGALYIRVTPYSADFAKEVATQIKDHLGKQGVGVAATIYQDPDKHWGRIFVEGITVVLRVLAVVSLFMSVILVLNTLTALITQQTNQIGIIKAIGGTTGDIVKVYLAGVLVYGFLALFIALPLGAYLSFGLTQWFLNLFNIDYNAFQVSKDATILQVAAAIVVPLLAALWPVLGGAATTVRAAIASYGLGGDFGSNWFDRIIERIGQRFLSSPYAIALGNLFRRKGRLLLTQLVLITAGIMFLAVMNLSASLDYTLTNDFKRRNYDAILYFQEYQRVDRAVDIAQSVDGVEKAEVRFAQPASLLRQGQRTKEAGIGSQLSGVPAGSDFYTPLIVAGRWLQPGDGQVVVMNEKTAEDNHIQLGDTVTLDLAELGKDDWQVVGFYRLIFSGDFSTDIVYAPRDAMFEAVKKYNKGDRLFIQTSVHDAEYTSALTERLKDVYKSRNVKVVESTTTAETLEQARGQFGLTTTMLMSLAVVVAVVGGIGLMGSLSISVVERTREIGVMRAIGARSLTIIGMFLMEGILQGLISWVVAVPVSFFLGRPMADSLGQVMFSTGLDYQYNAGAVVVWLVVILVISTLASILPARNATRISVRDSLAYS